MAANAQFTTITTTMNADGDKWRFGMHYYMLDDPGTPLYWENDSFTDQDFKTVWLASPTSEDVDLDLP